MYQIMGRLFSIADIHGRLDLLNKLLETLYTQYSLDLTKDKIVFTGDYVDRGPDSYGVLSRLKKLEEDHPGHVIVLAGNHEWINIMYYARGTEDDKWLHDNNGGPETKLSYQLAGYNGMTQDHLQWLSKLPLQHEEPGFFFSHAPVPRESYRKHHLRGTEITPDELIWTYHADEPGVARDHGNGVIGVCGHVHALRKGIKAPRFYDHYIYGDSGCGCSDKAPLCAIEVKTREVIYAWP
jgi:Calcineurin-like phosphoesterase